MNVVRVEAEAFLSVIARNRERSVAGRGDPDLFLLFWQVFWIASSALRLPRNDAKSID